MFHDSFMVGMGYGWIFWIAIIVLIGFLIIKFTNQSNSNRGIYTGKSALDILKKRFAKGDISKEKFERMKKDFIKI